MCGIAGVLGLDDKLSRQGVEVSEMIEMITHRGPESIGVYRDENLSLAHARLSIFDLAGGLQPLSNEDMSIWTSCNGEIYNFPELRAALVEQGHRFRTFSDTEVLIHLYEEQQLSFVNKLNGQFAFALWDQRHQRLILGRDRLGVRPLFYTLFDGQLLFASEIKALLRAGIGRQVDIHTLAQIFTTWSPLSGRTLFNGIFEVPPGHILIADVGSLALELHRYWQVEFTSQASQEYSITVEEQADEIRTALNTAVKLRLRADVPVGTYLSGGLDSALVTALAQRNSAYPLHTFSVTFADREFDERQHQLRVAQQLGTIHHAIECTPDLIRSALPEVIWHTEVPILRLTPVPMYFLSACVHDQQLKVVLTGEGADEFFAGYDLFKEAMVRRFWARVPSSDFRYLLFKRVYEEQPLLKNNSPLEWRQFFSRNLKDTSSPLYSHLIRWRNTYRISNLFSRQLRDCLADYSALTDIQSHLPPSFTCWQPLAQAQYLEISTFLCTYLLSSQGDRVAMAHAVEGRYPFLDHELIESINRIPAEVKLKGLRGEKYLLKQAARGLVPSEILNRPKQPYRAPIQSVFAGRGLPEYAEELLSSEQIERTGIFDPNGVKTLVRKFQTSPFLSEIDQMAFVGILTFQLFEQLFISGWNHSYRNRAPISNVIDVRERTSI